MIGFWLLLSAVVLGAVAFYFGRFSLIDGNPPWYGTGRSATWLTVGFAAPLAAAALLARANACARDGRSRFRPWAWASVVASTGVAVLEFAAAVFMFAAMFNLSEGAEACPNGGGPCVQWQWDATVALLLYLAALLLVVVALVLVLVSAIRGGKMPARAVDGSGVSDRSERG